ncbi:MAG: DUF4231 domain-containing protein [Anaerolineae bacterium]|nr:DUF4231 domain-containing protein [Anaerolineae bacterium]
MGQPVDQASHSQEIQFPNGNQARLVAPPTSAQPTDVFNALEIPRPEAIIIISGGASGLGDKFRSRLSQLFSRGVARVALELDALIIDGGTQSGVMAMMGQGVADRGHKTPLLGVVPAGQVVLPDGTGQGKTPLEPNHSHFVLVDSDKWGGETKTMYDIPAALAQNIPVVTVLVNGGSLAKQEILRSVREGWPVIVIQNSGRLADEIARLWQRKQRQGKGLNKILDWMPWREKRVDPTMAEIIDEGHLHFFRLDGSVAELQQLLRNQLRQLKTSSTLEDAWKRFAVYDQNAINLEKFYLRLRKWILGLGVIATTLAVLYSFLEPFENPIVVQTNFYLRFLVIAAPILVSILSAGSVKFARGVGWILLRSSAEAIKREIYRYRTRAEIYSQKQTNTVETRESKLARKVKLISQSLMKSEVNQSSLKPYTGIGLPPPPAVAEGDDGFSDLNPEQYLTWRLEHQYQWFQGRVVHLDQQSKRLHWWIFILGGIGTFLAAIGLEIWIAVTVAIAGALTALLELRQTETTLTIYNQAAADLESVRLWWYALPDKQKAEPRNFEKLVENTEDVLQSEHAGWVQEMRDALAELYRSNGKDSSQ